MAIPRPEDLRLAKEFAANVQRGGTTGGDETEPPKRPPTEPPDPIPPDPPVEEPPVEEPPVTTGKKKKTWRDYVNQKPMVYKTFPGVEPAPPASNEPPQHQPNEGEPEQFPWADIEARVVSGEVTQQDALWFLQNVGALENSGVKYADWLAPQLSKIIQAWLSGVITQQQLEQQWVSAWQYGMGQGGLVPPGYEGQQFPSQDVTGGSGTQQDPWILSGHGAPPTAGWYTPVEGEMVGTPEYWDGTKWVQATREPEGFNPENARVINTPTSQMHVQNVPGPTGRDTAPSSTLDPNPLRGNEQAGAAPTTRGTQAPSPQAQQIASDFLQPTQYRTGGQTGGQQQAQQGGMNGVNLNNMLQYAQSPAGQSVINRLLQRIRQQRMGQSGRGF